MVGTPFIVKNCCPNELVKVHDKTPVEELQTDPAANRLLKVVWRDELMTIIELAGRTVFARVSVAVDTSPTKGEEADIEHVIIFGLIVNTPVLAKEIPESEAVIAKLLANWGLTTVTAIS